VIPFVGIYPKEYKPGYNTDTCIPMVTEALFTILKLWKLFPYTIRCLINGLRKCGIYTQYIFYSTIKNEIMLLAGKWMEMKMMLSKVSQVQKDKGGMFSLICGR
jgi:hypothetical protein